MDVQSLVNAIKERLKQNTLSSSYSNFDDFSAYTGTNEKVWQLIKEKAEAEQAKIQNPYNKHIEDVYNATNKSIKSEDRATVLKDIGAYSFTSINFGELRNEEAAVAKAYDESFNPDGSFNFKAYQESINSILKNKLKQDLVYTGKNESIQDYFRPKHPADFHQITVNKLLEAHVKVKPWWNETGPSLFLGDEELIKQFHQSEFCKIIQEHPILKELPPYERKRLYVSIFKGGKGRYDIPAFIQMVKKALQKYPYFYQSYADFSEYTGGSDAVKAVQAEELAAVQGIYNKFLEKTYEDATDSYYRREVKIDCFEKINHYIFLSIEPGKLNQLSLLDSYIASLDENNKFDLLAFQTALNSVLETNLNLKMQYTGTDKEILKALQVSVARNAVESKPSEIPAVLDKPKENTRERQPALDDVPVPRAEAEPSPHLFFSASSSTKKEKSASNLKAYILAGLWGVF